MDSTVQQLYLVRIFPRPADLCTLYDVVKVCYNVVISVTVVFALVNMTCVGNTRVKFSW